MKNRPIQFMAAMAAAVSFLAQPGVLLAAPTYFFATTGDNVLNIGDFTVATYESGLTISPFGDATRTGQTYMFPIIGGAVDAETVLLESVSTGGMRFSNGTEVVSLNSPIVNTTASQPIITFLVSVNGNLQGRFAIFNLKVPNYAKPRTFTLAEKVNFTNISVTLGEEGATILNNALKTNFMVGLEVGTLKVKMAIGQKIPG
jgi:hypothetical protein